jgi:hypothetical protein
MNARTGGGGAATQAGIIYQNRVAAWFATRILAERDASPPLGLSADISLEFLRCETEQPVDDLLIGTSAGGHLFIQVKHSLDLDRRENSPLASAFNQFVRQFIVYRGSVSGRRPWERALDPGRDRLLLVTSPQSSARIREDLPSVLRRLRTLNPEHAIDDAANTDFERLALNAVRDHLTRTWRVETGSPPLDREVREILTLLWIQILDVDEGGDEEREAKDILRTTVLKDPIRADNAWDSLIQACGQYAIMRDGADRLGLEQVLFTGGIGVNAPRSYRDDIERLQRYSQSIVAAAADLSRIRVSSAEEVKIDRRSTHALRDAAESGSLVVVGEPGVGKSGALHDFVENLSTDENRDVIYFAVDHLEANSLGSLRNELGLAHEINDILMNWPGASPGFLVIDALDAARNDQTSQTIRFLLANTLNQNSRWKVVVSIRKFDLRYDQHLQKLFNGRPPTEFQDPEFGTIRHLNIPPLTGEELADACRQSPSLLSLVNSIIAGEHFTLLNLLANPFNLRLVGELLNAEIGVETLIPIRTQIELLDRYWKERVIGNDWQGDIREAVLRRIVKRMVETRSLRVDRSEVINDLAAGTHLSDLQSAHLLIDWQPAPEATPNRYILTFAHHLLFDYAVARLLLRGDVQMMIARLEQDVELVVVVRPSLVLHFQHEWLKEPDRRSFWDLVFRVIGSPRIPEVGKVIGPSVAAELTANFSDCHPLVECLEERDSAVHHYGEQALRHLARSLLVPWRGYDRPLIGTHAPPWCELLERVTRQEIYDHLEQLTAEHLRLIGQVGWRLGITHQVFYDVRPLLMEIYSHSEQLTDDQLRFMGQVARRLLWFAWTQLDIDQSFVAIGLSAVARTFVSDATASAELIRKCLEPAHLAHYGYLEVPQLADEIDRLIEVDPTIVGEIYRAAFSYREESTEATPMIGSLTFSFASNRAQDYRHALWQLAGSYMKFLEHAPSDATKALIVALDVYVVGRRLRQESSDEPEERFDFNGLEAIIKTDYSEIWDSGSFSENVEPLRMLNKFTEYLEHLGEDPARSANRMELINIIATQNQRAVIWRRLLKCGAAAPKTTGVEIRSLGWAIPILTGYDTTRVVGDYLKRVFGFLTPVDRGRIEQAILSIPSTVDEESREAAERTRDRLLWCLPYEMTITPAAKTRIQQLEREGGGPSNERHRYVSGGVWSRPTDEDFLASQGVPVEEESNRRMQELTRPVQGFTEGHRNTAPTGQEIDQVLPHLRTLREAVGLADEEEVHPKQRDYAWGTIITAGAVIAKTEKLSCSGQVGAMVREVLLEGVRHPDPVHHPENDAHFDEHQGWSIPAPRVDAAEGLMLLVREPSCVDQRVLEAIEQLSCDDVPAVRFQIARLLGLLYYTAPDLMWRLIGRMCREERSCGVLHGLLREPLIRLAGPHADRIIDLVKIIYDRITDGRGAKNVRIDCTDIFTNLYLWRDHPSAREAIFTIASDPSRYTDEAYQIAFILRDPLTHGSGDGPSADEDAIRRRALTLMGQLLSNTCERFNRLQARYRNNSSASWSVQEQEEAKRLVSLADGLATEIYFASGAFDDQNRGDADARSPLSESEKLRFLQDAAPFFDDLADLGIPRVAHHVVQTLEHLLDFDPAVVLLKIGRVVRASRNSQYPYDPSAAKMIVTIVSRFLAEHRHLLREREDCRHALIDILNIFVVVGWPSALRLAYRLEEMYR